MHNKNTPLQTAAFSALLLIAGLVFAEHFAFSVPDSSWDDIAAVNEANVQRRAGLLNVARRVHDTVTATFSDGRSGAFRRVLLVSSHAFRQTGGPFGGGSCLINNPMMSALSPEGEVSELGYGMSAPLTVRGTAADGTTVVLDQFAVAHFLPTGMHLTYASFGFGKLFQTQASNVETTVSEHATSHAHRETKARIPALAKVRPDDTHVLMIKHQGAHPANHNFAPTPQVLFTSRPIRLSGTGVQKGWAVMTFEKSGELHNLQVLPIEGSRSDPALAAALQSAVRTRFQDHRSHPHTVYLAFAVDRGQLVIRGSPVVSLPMCCSCDPDPYDGIEYQCP